MPEINPTLIRQGSPDTGAEITPDGNPVQQQAAPSSSPPPPAPVIVDKPAPAEVEKTTTEELPAEVETDNAIDFNDFVNARSDIVDKAKVDAAKPKSEAVDDKSTEIKVAPKVSTTARDFTGIDDSDVPLFKQMANDSFNKLKPIYLEHKKAQNELKQRDTKIAELEKGVVKLPDSYYEHPSAVVLTPEFQQANSNLSLSQQIFSHWADQLTKVREGASEYEIIDIDRNTGELKVVSKAPADSKAEMALLTYFNHAQQQATNQQKVVDQLVANHTNVYRQSMGWLQDFQTKALGVFDKPETKKQYDPVISSVIQSFPSTFRANPLAVPLAKALIVINELAAVQRNGGAAAQQQAGAQIKSPKAQADKRRAGPTASETGAGSSGAGNESEVTVDDFERVKAGY